MSAQQFDNKPEYFRHPSVIYASASDIPANTLVYSFTGSPPTGAAITTAGAFTWTPTEAQGPGDYSITIRVSDGSASDSKTFSVHANDVNITPTLKISRFYAPVDMKDSSGHIIVNTVKSGKTVPLKFGVFDVSNLEQTSTSVVQSFKQNTVRCSSLSGDATDEIELTTTGGTSLRYDTDGGIFIQNWKTPSSSAGKCFSVTVTTIDGSFIAAFFKLT